MSFASGLTQNPQSQRQVKLRVIPAYTRSRGVVFSIQVLNLTDFFPLVELNSSCVFLMACHFSTHVRALLASVIACLLAARCLFASPVYFFIFLLN